MATSRQGVRTSQGGDDRNVRLLIVDAAFSVLQEVGPTRLRVQEVARRAGVSATLLYYYFDGKHALIAAAYARDYALILERDLELTRAVLAGSKSASELFASTLETYSLTFNDRDIRRRRLDALSAAQHDPLVAAAIAPLQKDYIDELRTQVEAMALCRYRHRGLSPRHDVATFGPRVQRPRPDLRGRRVRSTGTHGAETHSR